MSTTIDHKVVEMRFDNKHFESNVSTTMSTLDKLKQKLNLQGASKGLDDISASARKVDMSGLSRGVETVTAKFSALQVMGTTALVNLTNQAVNAGKRITHALTIAPISDGFHEYEMTLNAVQTTMAGTGKTAKEVEAELKKLDEYADKTVYSTADMLNNLPKFTNAGVELETATKAMIGIANATALAGGDAGKASIAFYNLGQAIGTGYLTRMDYNSINNAGIATMEWKNQMVEAAIAQGTLTKVGEDAYKAGNKTLTLQQLFIDGLQEQWATTDVMIEVFGKYGSETEDIGKKAYAAAQDIKTYSMMMDSLKATAGTGWKDTWQIIFGNLDEAKEFWTGLSNFLSGIITKMADFRNGLLESVLGSKWSKFTKKINEAGVATDTFSEKLKAVAKENNIPIDELIGKYGSLEEVMKKGYISAEIVAKTLKALSGSADKTSESTEDLNKKLKYFQDVVNKVWKGDYKNGKARIEALTKAGYDYATVQDLVNKTVDGHKLTLEDLTDVQLENLGYTEEQITKIRELADEAEKAGTPLNELINTLYEPSGKDLLIDSFKNIGKVIGDIIRSIADAWNRVFGEYDQDKASDSIYGLIEKFHELTESMQFSEESAGRLTNILEGIFSALDISWSLASKSLLGGLKILNEILKLFGTDVFGVLEKVAGYITKFNHWIEDNTIFGAESKWADIAAIIVAIYEGVRDCAKAFLGLEESTGFIEGIKEKFGDFFDKLAEFLGKFDLKSVVSSIEQFFDSIENWIKDGMSLEKIGTFITDGLAEGIWEGAKNVVKSIIEVAKNLLNSFMDFLGIHSPSKVFIALGGFIIAGLLLGLKEGLISVPESLKGIVDKCLGVIEKIDWSSVFAVGVSIGGLLLLKKMIDILELFASPLEGFNKVCSATSDAIKSFGKVADAMSMNIKAKAIRSLVISLAILVGCILAIVKIGDDSYGKMWHAVLLIGALAGILIGLTWAMNKLSDASVSYSNGKLDINGLKQNLLTIGLAIGILGVTVKMLGSMDHDQYMQGMEGLIGACVLLVAVVAVMSKLTTSKGAKNLDRVSSMMLKLSIAMIAMVGVAKLAGKLDKNEILKGAGFAAGFLVFTTALSLISKISNNRINGLSKMLIKVAISMGLMVGVMKLVDLLTIEEVIQGIAFVLLFTNWLVILASITHLVKQGDIANVGKMMLSVSISMGVMALVCKLIGRLSVEEMLKGAAFAIAFAGFVGILVSVTSIASDKQIAKIGGTILSIAIAMGILALLSVVLGNLSTEALVKGIAAVGALSLMMSLMIYSLKGANDIKSTLITMTVAIGLLVLSVATLSLIAKYNPKGLIMATSAVVSLVGIFAILVKSATYVQNAWRTITVMLVTVVALAGVLWAMSALDVQNSLQNAGALSILMVAMAACMQLISKVKISEGDIWKVVKTVVAMAALAIPMLAFAVVLNTMSGVQNAITNVIALGVLMAAMTLVLIPLALMGSFALSAVPAIIALTAMAVPMLAFVEVLKRMSGIKDAMNNVIVLSALMAAMTLLLIPLTILGSFALMSLGGILALTAMAVPLLAFVFVLSKMEGIQNASANVALLSQLTAVLTLLLIPLTLVGVMAPFALAGVLALTAMAVPLLLLVGILALMQNIQNAAANVELITKLLVVLTSVLVVLAMVGPLAVTGIYALGMLTVLMGAIGVFVTAVGLIMTAVPWLQTLLDTGIVVLEKIAYGLGSFVGNLVTGFLNGGILDILPRIGTQLSKFMDGAMPFINGVKLVDGSVLAGVGILAAAIIALTAADLITGMISFVSGGSFSRLGTELSLFMMNAMPFILGASMLNETMMNGVKALTEAILILTAANVLEGLTSWLTGGNSLGSFASQLPILGQGIANFIDAVGDIDESKVTIAANAAKIIKELASAAAEIPNAGGLLASLVGDNDMAAWAEQLPVMGKGIADFIIAVGELDDSHVEIASKAAEVIKILAEAAAEIPNTGGLLADLIGDNDLATFAEGLPDVGKGIAGFVAEVSEVNGETVEIAKSAAGVITALAGVAQEIPNTGGFLADLIGDNDLSTFAEGLPDVGKGIAGFMSEVDGFNEGSVTSVNAAVSAIESFASLANSDLSGFKKNISGFGEKLTGFATHIGSFCTKMSETSSETISSAITIVNNLKKMLTGLEGVNSDVADEFKNAIETIGKTGFDKFVNALSGSEAKADVKKSAKDMISNAIDGFNSKQDAFNKALKTLVTTGVSEVKTQDNKDKFYKAGSYLVDGFAAGISENTYKAEAKAAAMASAAYKSAKEALDINSPSKVFRSIGYSVPEGFAMGIDKLSGMVRKSATGMAEGAIENVKSSIIRLSDAINGDIDSQPTIRPVLDLSDVRNGASAINGLFTNDALVGVRANVSSISSSMNGNIQNGDSEIVSAINKLRKDLGNVGNTTYQINGITYDDGSALQDAFGTIVRQARMERRV